MALSEWDVLPATMRDSPVPLVGVVGLNEVSKNGSVHNKIWRYFVENRDAVGVDRSPMAFKLLPYDHVFPLKKDTSGRSSLYIPDGVLPTSWMEKHRNIIPATMVLFFDLEWNDVNWGQREMECVSVISELRRNIGSHNIKIVVVLIQSHPQAPPGDPFAEERAISFRRACGLEVKNALFILPSDDEGDSTQLTGYILRLESFFFELVCFYYKEESRRVKKRRDALNKSTQQLLLIRCNFKLAYFADFRQDTATALKYYQICTQLLMELRHDPTHCCEFKIIAGMTNYKVCKLLFLSSTIEAVDQFHAHINCYRFLNCNNELPFEHWAWVSLQYKLFAELFETAIKHGLAIANRTANPGFFFQEAAKYAIERKNACLSVCSSSSSTKESEIETSTSTKEKPDCTRNSSSSMIVEKATQSKFYGQTTDSMNDQDLYILERKVPHSTAIVTLLTRAWEHFKRLNSPRMSRHMKVLTAEEYVHSCQYEKALCVFKTVSEEYRRERWWTVLASVLTKSLLCAYLLGSIKDFVMYSLELIPDVFPDDVHTLALRKQIQGNLIDLLCARPPCYNVLVVDSIGVDQIAMAQELWNEQAPTETGKALDVDMMAIAPVVDCKVQFLGPSFSSDSPIALVIYVRTSAPNPLFFSQLRVTFSNAAYNEACILTCDNQSDIEAALTSLSEHKEANNRGGSAVEVITVPPSSVAADPDNVILRPGHIKAFLFTFSAHENIYRNLECARVTLRLGPSTRYALLQWNVAERFRRAAQLQDLQLTLLGSNHNHSPTDTNSWEDIVERPLVRIVPREPLVEVEACHRAPALIGEVYPVHLVICSRELSNITDVNVVIDVLNRRSLDTTSVTSTTSISSSDRIELFPPGDPVTVGSTTPLTKINCIELDDLTPNERTSTTFFVRGHREGVDAVVRVRLLYNITVDRNDGGSVCGCAKEISLQLDIVPPFNTACQLQSMLFDDIDEHVTAIRTSSPFLLASTITCTTPFPLRLIRSVFELASNSVDCVGDDNGNQTMNDIVLQPNDAISRCIGISVAESSSAGIIYDKRIRLGSLSLYFSRSSLSMKWIDKQKDNNDEEAERNLNAIMELLPPVKTTVQLPFVTIERPPLSVTMSVPAFGQRDVMLPVSFFIRNCSKPIEVSVMLEASESFMFSGIKESRILILPHSTHTLRYFLLPMAVGQLDLPRLRISCDGIFDDKETTEGNGQQILQPIGPKSIYIRPFM